MSERRITMATTWLDGCSGCHMSFLDLDERLVELAEKVEVVYSPLVDAKELPASVDVGLVEGAVSTEDDLVKARAMRRSCKYLVGFGDCAVTGNVPSLRNAFDLDAVFDRAFVETATVQPQRPTEGLPRLLHPVRPLHAVVNVDSFMPGCPPSADTIWYYVTELLAGRTPDPAAVTRFGA